MWESLENAIVGGGILCLTIGMAHALYPARRRRWQTVFCWAFCVFPIVLSARLLQPVLGGRSEEAASLFLLFGYFYLFDAPVWQLLFTFLGIHTLAYAAALAARFTALLLREFWPAFPADAGFVLFYFVLVIASVYLFWEMFRERAVRWLGLSGRQLRSIPVFAGTGYLFLLSFDIWAERVGISGTEVFQMILLFLLLGTGYSLAFFHIASAWEADEARRQAERITKELRQSEKYYETLAVHQQKIRRMEHDMRHHFRVLESCLRNGQLPRMQSYLADLLDSIPEHAGPSLCANYTAGILLGYYAERAASAGIRFQCDAQIPTLLSIQDSHLSVVLGNALQNALEACLRLPDGGTAFIELLARVRSGFLTLEVKNSFDGRVLYDSSGEIRSGKAESGHGLGLDSVADIAQRYHGYYSAKPEGKVFVLRVVLTLAPE